MKLDDLEIYNLSMIFSEKVWEAVMLWEYFAKDTIGKQWVRAADSISANISEGFGRYSFIDSRRFYYIARGSLYESKTWLDKSKNRHLISEELHKTLFNELNTIGYKLNKFIKTQTLLMSQTNK